MTSRICRRAFLRRALFLGAVGASWASSGCGVGDALALPDNPLRDISLPGFLGGSAPAGEGRRRVAVGFRPGAKSYPEAAPFDPTEEYLEYPYDERPGAQGAPNEAYALVRDALRAWNPVDYGSRAWNPLSTIVKPGDRVLIKPNLVWEGWWSAPWVGLATSHASTVRAVIDYVYKACGKLGEIIVGDATANAREWRQVVRTTQLDRVVDHLREDHGVPVRLVDLNATSPEHTPLVKLGKNSVLHGLDQTLFDLHDKPDWYSTHFGAGTYQVSPLVYEAGVFISVAKMKVHRMAGISAAMKNLFGIIPSWDGPYGDDRLKDVPHYSSVDKKDGDAGLYPGNDTVWRTIADLNRIVLYSDEHGNLRETRRRRYLGIVDGLLAGGKDMLNPEPKLLKVLVVGDEPASNDAVVARLMGYDHRKIKSISLAGSSGSAGNRFPLGPTSAGSIEVVLLGADSLAQVNDGRQIVTPDVGAYSWIGRIEASDFEGPVLRGISLRGSEVSATLEDSSGVEFARLYYAAAGRRYFRELSLSGGNGAGGTWRASVAPESRLTEVVLETGDQLFNVTRYPFSSL